MTVRFQLETTIPSGLMDLYKLSKCRLGYSPGCVRPVKLCVEEENAPLFVCVWLRDTGCPHVFCVVAGVDLLADVNSFPRDESIVSIKGPRCE